MERDQAESNTQARDVEVYRLRDCETSQAEEIRRLNAVESLLLKGKAVVVKENDKLKRDIDSCQSNLEAYKLEKTESEAKLVAQETVLEKQNAEITNLESDLEHNQAALAEHNTKITSLQSDLMNSQATLAEHMTKITKAETALATSQAEVKERSTALANLEKTVANKDNVLAEQDTKNKALEFTLAASQAELDKQKTKVSTLEAALATKEDRGEEQNTKIIKLKAVLVTREKELKEQEKKVTSLEESLAESHATLEEKNTSLRHQQRRVADVERANQVSLNFLRKIEGNLAEKEREAEKKIEEYRKSNVRCVQYSKEVEEKNAELANLEQQLEEKRNELDLGSIELDACQGEIKQLQEEVQASNGKLATSRNDCERLRKENEVAASSAENNALEMSSLEDRLTDLGCQRDAALLDTTAKIMSFQKQIQDLIAERDAAEQKVQKYTGTSASDNKALSVVASENHVAIKHEAFLSPYKHCPDPRLEIFVDGRVVSRGFENTPASQEEFLSLQEAGSSVADGKMACSTCGTAIKPRTVNGELCKRDIALEEKVEEDREEDWAAKRAERLSLVQPDPRLRSRPKVTGSAPVAVMVASKLQPIEPAKETQSPTNTNVHSEARLLQPDPTPRESLSAKEVETRRLLALYDTRAVQASSPQSPSLTYDGSTKPAEIKGGQLKKPTTEPLRRVSADLPSEAGSLQTPALTHDENMTPRETGPHTPRSPRSTLKRKEPTDLFDPDVLARRAKELGESSDPRTKRPDTMEDRSKRIRVEDMLNPTESAPREPRRMREYNRAERDRRSTREPRRARDNNYRPSPAPARAYSDRCDDDHRRHDNAYDSYRPAPSDWTESGRRSPEHPQENRGKWR